jgi:GDPmannose 4,6-dehydratase
MSAGRSCLYTVAKNASRDLIQCYRRDHGIKASVLHLFNHETERRPPSFFMPTLACALRRALSDSDSRAEIETLQFFCDWGSAEEYMDIAADIAERALGNDVILATGRTWSAAELAQAVFSRHGLDYRKHLIERTAVPEPQRPFRVSVERLASLIGRVPALNAVSVCEKMAAALRLVRQAGR